MPRFCLWYANGIAMILSKFQPPHVCVKLLTIILNYCANRSRTHEFYYLLVLNAALSYSFNNILRVLEKFTINLLIFLSPLFPNCLVASSNVFYYLIFEYSFDVTTRRLVAIQYWLHSICFHSW